MKPLKKTKISETVVDLILELIKSGELKPGDRMPSERELAQELQVSRTSVREAFRALESMGYTEAKVGGGTFVRTFDLDTLVQPISLQMLQSDHQIIHWFVEVRLILETQGAALATQRATSFQLLSLDEILEEMELDIKNGGCGQEQDRKFHIQLIRCAGNPAILTVFEACQGILAHTSQLIIQLPEQPVKALQGHRDILERIRAKDAVGAASAMENHLTQIYDFIERL